MIEKKGRRESCSAGRQIKGKVGKKDDFGEKRKFLREGGTPKAEGGKPSIGDGYEILCFAGDA